MELIITVQGMMCGHCEAHVKKAVEALPNVAEAVADHVSGKVTVKTTGEVPHDALKAAIEAEGYSVTDIH